MKATFIERTNVSDEYSVESLSTPDQPHAVHLSSFVTCDCGKFVFKLGKGGAVSIDDTEHHCAHIDAAKAEQKRLGLQSTSVAVLRPCCGKNCHHIDAEYNHANDDGTPSGKFICADCVGKAKYWNMRGEGNEPDVSEFLASHAPTPEEKQQEAEHFAQLDGAENYAVWMEQQRLIEIEDYQGEVEDDYEPEYVSNDLYGGMRRERAL